MNSDGLLVLQDRSLTEAIAGLFLTLREKPEERNKFLQDPAAILGLDDRFPAQSVSIANALLYDLMQTPGVLAWIRDYAQEHQGKPPRRQEFMSDFQRAVIESGGEHFILRIVRESVEKLGRIRPLGIITHSSIIASGMIVSTDQGAAQDHRSSQNFSYSTEFNAPTPTTTPQFGRHDEEFGGLNILGSHYLRTAVEALVAEALEIDNARDGDRS
jgi:hypothetical protein